VYDLSNGSITNDLEWFQGHIVTIWIDALDIGLLCAQLRAMCLRQLSSCYSIVKLLSDDRLLCCCCRRHFRRSGVSDTATSVSCFTWSGTNDVWQLNILTKRRLSDSCRRCSTAEWSSFSASWRWRWPTPDCRSTITNIHIASPAVTRIKYLRPYFTKHKSLTRFLEGSSTIFWSSVWLISYDNDV